MTRYLAGRVAQAIGVLWAAYTVTFIVLYALPSDPAEILANQAGGSQGTASAAEVAKIRTEFGFDQPILEQYWHHLVSALHGDFGQSVSQGRTVSALLKQNIPPTFQLALVSIVITIVIGSLLAYAATYVSNRPLRLFLQRLPAVNLSFPSFWIGLLLIQLFSFSWHLFPATGTDGFSTLVLPGLTMAIPASGVLAQVLIRGLDDTLAEPYVTTARAKGVSKTVIHLKHAFRNAALPALTILGLLVGTTVTQAVVAETVFSRTGLGRLAQQAVLAQDIPLVQGIVVVAAALFVVVNLIVDLLYPLLDPRVTTVKRRTPKAGVPARTDQPTSPAGPSAAGPGTPARTGGVA